MMADIQGKDYESIVKDFSKGAFVLRWCVHADMAMKQ